MNRQAVRFRLALVVAALTLVAVALAATVGVAALERALVRDLLDREEDRLSAALAAMEAPVVAEVGLDGSGERLAVPVEVDEGEVAEEVEEVDAVEGDLVETELIEGDIGQEAGELRFSEELDFVVEEVERLVADLDDDEVIEPLLAAVGRDRTDGLPVLHASGWMVIVGLDSRPSVMLDPGADLPDPATVDANLYELRPRQRQGAEGSEGDDGATPAPRPLDVVTSVTPSDAIDLVVAADVAEIRGVVSQIRRLLWLGGPMVLLVVTAAAWVLTGRALQPVRGITDRVAAISAGTLHERVPVPNSGDEIEELGTTMNAMLERLDADDRRLRRFVSDASHELRSPIAVLRSQAEVALRTEEETKVPDLAAGVLDESLRLERIVDDLLVLARGDEVRGPIASGVVDLDDIVLAEAARDRRVPVDTGAVSAGRVAGTIDGCTRIVVHLLDNAARHAATTVLVGLRGADGWVELTVDDDGGGIPATERTRVFERFTRLEAARSRDTGGAGLGLAVVAATVSGFGGTVAAEESPLGGARFVVRLPAPAAD
ncbi:MAG: ATP-binding protein [Actinomycetota bacterium]